eukprot:456322-Hanusia_phi.AAC.2
MSQYHPHPTEQLGSPLAAVNRPMAACAPCGPISGQLSSLVKFNPRAGLSCGLPVAGRAARVRFKFRRFNGLPRNLTSMIAWPHRTVHGIARRHHVESGRRGGRFVSELGSSNRSPSRNSLSVTRDSDGDSQCSLRLTSVTYQSGDYHSDAPDFGESQSIRSSPRRAGRRLLPRLITD